MNTKVIVYIVEAGLQSVVRGVNCRKLARLTPKKYGKNAKRIRYIRTLKYKAQGSKQS